MLPSQFDPSQFHPEGELVVLDPRDAYVPDVIKAYAKHLQKEASNRQRRKYEDEINGRPISYWLRKKAQGLQESYTSVNRFQARHPEIVRLG